MTMMVAALNAALLSGAGPAPPQQQSAPLIAEAPAYDAQDRADMAAARAQLEIAKALAGVKMDKIPGARGPHYVEGEPSDAVKACIAKAVVHSYSR